MPVYDLYLDIANHRLVSGIENSTGQALRLFAQNDTPSLALHALVRETDPGSLNYYREVPFPYSTMKAGISKAVDAPPRAGTYRVRVVGTTAQSDPIGVTTDKPGFAVILNAMAEVISRGGVTVDEGGAPNLFVVRWVASDVEALFEIIDNRLTPHSFGRVYEYAGEEGSYQVLKTFVAPFAFTDDFELPGAPAVLTANVRVGSSAANAIQSIRVPAGATGQVAFSYQTLQSSALNVPSLTAAQIQGALNAIIPDGTTRFLVNQPAPGLFNVEFVGPLAAGARPLLGIAMFGQDAVLAPVGKLALTSTALEVIQDAGRVTACILEIAGINEDGDKEVLIQEPVTILNDMLDSAMALDVPGWLQSATEAATISGSDPKVPIISGSLSWSVIFGDQSARIFTFTHSLSTIYPIVEVYSISPYRRIPDNEYAVGVDDANHLTLTFAVPPEEDSLRILICNVEAQTVLNLHHHAIDHVDGLQDALDAINSLFDVFELASPLPVSMIPKLPWSILGYANPGDAGPGVIPDLLLPINVVRTNASGYLPLSSIPPEVPRLDANGNLVVGVLQEDGTYLSVTILNVKDKSLGDAFLGQLVGDLAAQPGFGVAVLAALAISGQEPMGMAQIPNAYEFLPGRFPEGYDFAEATPPRVGAPFPRAIHDVEAATLDADELPVPADHEGEVFQNFGGTPIIVPAAFSTRRLVVPPGGFLGSDGRFLYLLRHEGTTNSYFPTAMERTLFVAGTNEHLFLPGGEFSLSFRLSLQSFAANTAGQYLLVLELGNPAQATTPATVGVNLSNVVWNTATPIVSQRIIVSSVRHVIRAGCVITQDEEGALATSARLYDSTTAGAAVPASANFVVRARLINWDTEDAVEDARGTVSYALTEGIVVVS